MIPAVAVVLGALALAGAAWSAVLLILDRRLHDPLVWLLALLEVGLVAQLVGGAIALAGTGHDVDGVTFVGYQLTTVLALPVAVAWAASEKSRWGVGVLLIGCLTIAALVLRTLQVWQGQG